MTEPRVAVVLTALDIEYDAVREHLVDPEPERPESGTHYEIGTVRGTSCRVVIGRTGAGNKAAAALAERAINRFRPVALLFSGVAGALRDSIELGDVVVGSKIYAYHSAAGEDHGLRARPESWKLDHAVSEEVREIVRRRDWIKRLPAGSSLPAVRCGPIAAGEVVQKSRISQEARWINQHYNDAAAIEMEGAGIAEAGHLNRLPVGVVRGISDRAGGDKTVGNDLHWQPRAAANAAAFTIELAVALLEASPVVPRARAGADRVSSERDGVRPGGSGNVSNINVGGTVGAQGHTLGATTLQMAPAIHRGAEAELTEIIADLRALLIMHHAAGDLDRRTYQAARGELEVAESLANQEDDSSRTEAILAFKKLSGIVSDTAAVATKVALAVAALQGLA